MTGSDAFRIYQEDGRLYLQDLHLTHNDSIVDDQQDLKLLSGEYSNGVMRAKILRKLHPDDFLDYRIDPTKRVELIYALGDTFNEHAEYGYIDGMFM